MSCFYLAMASPAVGRYTYILRVFATMYTRECFMYRRIPCRRPVSLLRVFTDADSHSRRVEGIETVSGEYHQLHAL